MRNKISIKYTNGITELIAFFSICSKSMFYRSEDGALSMDTELKEIWLTRDSNVKYKILSINGSSSFG